MSSERSWTNPSRSAWRRGRWGWRSALDLKEITSKATCCILQFAFGIKDLSAQSRYFSSTPRIMLANVATGFAALVWQTIERPPVPCVWSTLYNREIKTDYFLWVFCPLLQSILNCLEAFTQFIKTGFPKCFRSRTLSLPNRRFINFYMRKTAGRIYLLPLSRNFSKTWLDNTVHYINSLRNKVINRMGNSGIIISKCKHSN